MLAYTNSATKVLLSKASRCGYNNDKP